MFKGKTIVLGVTGGIAAYKACEIARALFHSGIEVHVVMTESAQQFVGPLTLQTLSGNKVSSQMLDADLEHEIGHISLARRGDAILIAPATANFIGKVYGGIADDLLSTVVMAAKAPVLLAPAMNEAMWNNPIVRRNIAELKKLGYVFIEPQSGLLACNEEGVGKLAEVEVITEAVYSQLTPKLLDGRRVVIDAGPTREFFDPVRFISNRSSGKMGFALARIASRLGAEVTLISGPTALPDPPGVKLVRVQTAQQMLSELNAALPGADVMIAAAAVADFAPKQVAEQKIKKGELSESLALERTPDLLTETIKVRKGVFTVGFAAETHDLIKNAQDKMANKKIEMICANDVADQRIGFDSEENALTLLFNDGSEPVQILRMAKDQVALHLLETIAKKLGAK